MKTTPAPIPYADPKTALLEAAPAAHFNACPNCGRPAGSWCVPRKGRNLGLLCRARVRQHFARLAASSL